MRTEVSEARSHSINKLEEVFAVFNQVSADLGSSYKELEKKVEGLTKELASTHSARIKELTQKELLASKLSALMEALPGGVIVVNAQGIIKEENQAAINILKKNNLGNEWTQVFKDCASTDFIQEGEVSFRNGDRILISSSSYGDEGETIILLTDVSENYRLNNQINREKRLTALGEMAARLAHQIRTPLSSAILYLSHLSSSITQKDKNLDITQKILNRLRQIEGMTEGMLSYIRGDDKTTQLFSLNELLNEVKEAMSLELKESEGTLHLNFLEGESSVKANHEALFNALSNLVENAIQAVAHQPIITVTLCKVNDFYSISVDDNGPGIDDSVKDQIFDPFFSTRLTGTGLGLAVVLSAAKSHNGKVLIKDSEINGGASFQLLIPQNPHSNNDKSGIWGEEFQQFLLTNKKERA